MSETITLNKAVTLSLGELTQPVITSYQLCKIIFNIYAAGKFHGLQIQTQKKYLTAKIFNKCVGELIDLGLIQPNNNFSKSSVFNILGKDLSSADEILCTVDPFAYVSHLSAMEYHGLTDRIPKMLFYSSPAQARWREFARERMKKNFGDNLSIFYDSHLPKIVRINFSKINKRVVSRYASDHLGAFKSLKGKMLRVSTIGRTFLDMLRRPDLCGGINHVIDVYKEHSGKYLNLIINEIDANGKPIDKIRAGYILEEKCSLQNAFINNWLTFVQRGGSRKLDPIEEYSSNYSERWCLSINID